MTTNKGTTPRPAGTAPGVRSRSFPGRLGVEGWASAVLLLGTTGLLSAAVAPPVLGNTPAPGWAALSAAGAGLAAGLAGLVGLWRRPGHRGSDAAAPGSGEGTAPALRSLTEEVARLRREGADLSRTLAQTEEASARLADAAREATARLEASAESSSIAARSLALLPDLSENHASRIEQMAARAEHALSLIPEGLAARLDMLPHHVAAALAEERPAEARLQRLDAAGTGDGGSVAEGAARLQAVVQRLERAGAALVSLGEIMPQRLEQVTGALETRLDMMVPPLLDRLEELLAPIEAAGSALQHHVAAASETLAGGLAEQQARLTDAAEEITRTMRDQAAAFTDALAEATAMEARQWTQRIEEGAGLLQQQTSALAASVWPAVEAQAETLSSRIGGAAEAAELSLSALAGSVPEAVIPALQARLDEVLQTLLIEPVQQRLDLLVEGLRPSTEALARLAEALPSSCDALAQAAVAPAHVALRLEAAGLAIEAAARQAAEALAGAAVQVPSPPTPAEARSPAPKRRQALRPAR